MRRLPMILAVAAMAILLSSCAGFTPLGPQGPGDNTPSILGNLQGCYRQYQGSISAGLGAGASGSFNIICDPKVTPALDPAPVLLPPT